MHDDERERRLAANELLLALSQQIIDSNRQADQEVAALLDQVRATIERYGLKVTRKALTLAPIAQAKGDSDGEIEVFVDRFERGLDANIVVLGTPRNKRFPVEVISTGSLNPVAHLRPVQVDASLVAS